LYRNIDLPAVLLVVAEILVESQQANLYPTVVVPLVGDAAMLQVVVEEAPQDDQKTFYNIVNTCYQN